MSTSAFLEGAVGLSLLCFFRRLGNQIRAAAFTQVSNDEIYFFERMYHIVFTLKAGDGEYIELLKSSLQAALEALNPEAWVGLAVFSSRLGIQHRFTRQLPLHHAFDL